MPALNSTKKQKTTDKQDEGEPLLKIAGAKDEFVRVEKSITKKIGEYETAKMTVSVQLHMDATDEDIDYALETVKIINGKIDKVLVREVGKLLDNYGG